MGQLAGQFETEGVDDTEGVDEAGTAEEVAATGENAQNLLDTRMGITDETTEVAEVDAVGEDAMETAAIEGKSDEELAEAIATQEKVDAIEAAAEKLRVNITEKLAEALGEDAAVLDELSVKAVDGEVLISLTDAFEISMFEIGSAVPSRDLVIALEKIGDVLSEEAGGIRIHGHTDARPFRSKDYDNWRLSASRAQSAYYMLLRGGLEDTRVREISGFADRKLLDADDPYSPKNRRIEVMVEVETG
jgi:chemotaxis protein MotB